MADIFGDRIKLGGGQVVSLEERVGVGAGGELAGLLNPGGEVGGLVGDLVEVQAAAA